MAGRAPAGFDEQAGDVVSLPLYQQPAAVVAEGMIARMTRDVAHVYITNPGGHGQLAETDQGGHRRRGQAVQPIAGEKPQKMEGMVRAERLQDPVAHTLDHLRAVPVSRDYQVGDLKMNPQPVEGRKGVQHRL